ncbi:MAG TPA: hypothetical protein VFC00_13640 [Micromonosporaceae bacterium]|nr:hypothetical protein [Micromonosporaceae bacterium]
MKVKAQNAFRVSVPPRSSGVEIHSAMQALRDFQDEVHLHAGSVQFVTPREICGLRALIEHAAGVADCVRFDCPVNDDVHRYLARVDFYADLPANVDLSRPVPSLRRRDLRQRLIEVVRIRTPDDVEDLVGRVWGVAKGHFGIGSLAMACATAIAAATENVIDHARSPIGALVCAQRYQQTGLELAVVDLGRGIPTTLRQNPTHRGLTDLRAVERAIEDGVSSVQDQGRGAGLAELVHGVGRTRRSGLRLSSGRAELTLGWENGRRSRNLAVPAHPIVGTWLAVRLEART